MVPLALWLKFEYLRNSECYETMIFQFFNNVLSHFKPFSEQLVINKVLLKQTIMNETLKINE